MSNLQCNIMCTSKDTYICGWSGKCDLSPEQCSYSKRVYPRNPYLAVDAIIEMPDNKIVLIERKNEPFGFALPGGFVDYGESLEAAVCREVKEEVNMGFIIEDQFKAYSHPKRDPRQHVVSVVFIGTGVGTPTALDDAKENSAIVIDRFDALYKQLAFDHKSILYDYIDWHKNIRLHLEPL